MTYNNNIIRMRNNIFLISTPACLSPRPPAFRPALFSVSLLSLLMDTVPLFAPFAGTSSHLPPPPPPPQGRCSASRSSRSGTSGRSGWRTRRPGGCGRRRRRSSRRPSGGPSPARPQLGRGQPRGRFLFSNCLKSETHRLACPP